MSLVAFSTLFSVVLAQPAPKYAVTVFFLDGDTCAEADTSNRVAPGLFDYFRDQGLRLHQAGRYGVSNPCRSRGFTVQKGFETVTVEHRDVMTQIDFTMYAMPDYDVGISTVFMVDDSVDDDAGICYQVAKVKKDQVKAIKDYFHKDFQVLVAHGEAGVQPCEVNGYTRLIGQEAFKIAQENVSFDVYEGAPPPSAMPVTVFLFKDKDGAFAEHGVVGGSCGQATVRKDFVDGMKKYFESQGAVLKVPAHENPEVCASNGYKVEEKTVTYTIEVKPDDKEKVTFEFYVRSKETTTPDTSVIV